MLGSFENVVKQKNRWNLDILICKYISRIRNYFLEYKVKDNQYTFITFEMT